MYTALRIQYSHIERFIVEIANGFKIEPRPTIREEVYEYLRRMILIGKIPSGERLIEAKLAEELQISRTPVREALNRLEMEKLISPLPKAGYEVRGFNEQEVKEICDIRMVTEALAAKWAASKITSKELKRLDEIIILTDKFIESKEAEKIVELDTEFHDIICKASRSERIDEINQRLRDHMLKFRMKGLCKADVARRSNEGHKRIANAILEKNMKGIESAFRYHLTWTKKDVTRIIRSNKRGTF